MSVSAIAANAAAALPQTEAPSASNSAAKAFSTAFATAMAAGTSAPESSTQVTMSQSAQILAQLAADGYTYTIPSGSAATLAGIVLPKQKPGESVASYASQVFASITSTGVQATMSGPQGGSLQYVGPLTSLPGGGFKVDAAPPPAYEIPPSNGNGYDGEITQAAFDAVIEKFGGTQAQANQLFASFDTDDNGSVSHSELLKGMSNLGDSNSQSAQQLLGILVPGAGGTLTDGEFLSFDSAMVAAEKPAA